MHAIARRMPHLVGCTWFWAWALVGVAFALGFLSLGVLVLAPAVGVALLLARRRPANWFGLLSGIGVMLLVVAYVQRHGGGLNPLPWLVVGLVLFAAGVAGQAWRGVRER